MSVRVLLSLEKQMCVCTCIDQPFTCLSDRPPCCCWVPLAPLWAAAGWNWQSWAPEPQSPSPCCLSLPCKNQHTHTRTHIHRHTHNVTSQQRFILTLQAPTSQTLPPPKLHKLYWNWIRLGQTSVGTELLSESDDLLLSSLSLET